ncbi:cysteine proteinase [Gonapodya prolifera JEL478]|uniref:Cysteine proteinase n=1 Tax=Gonapodya prolifera (strain JEL478) TaxID=1344416 RepID=A0A139AYB7_GONPJ|nr:cysteine proteinase [Gonapodya prolifera JEL478]|eukprot:KXS21741.1 cysteine proteinase [Gonapodya prolifera JEL478]
MSVPEQSALLSDTELSLYLARIGMPNISRDPTFETLKAIVLHHGTSVTWESVNIHYPNPTEREKRASAIAAGVPWEPIKIKPDDVFDWIVRQERGHYCFGMNLLVKRVLRTLGFRVTDLVARISNPAQPLTSLTHRTLRVWDLPETPGGKGKHWVVDLGFGLSPLAPVALGTGDDPWQGPFDPVWIPGTTMGWRLRKGVVGVAHNAAPPSDADTLEQGVYLQAWHGEKHGWSDCYFIQPSTRYTDGDFAISNYYISTHPDSPFLKGLMIVKSQLLESTEPNTFHIRRSSYTHGELVVHDYTTGERSVSKIEDVLGADRTREAKQKYELKVLAETFQIKGLE